MEPASLALILGASAASSAASVYNNRQQIKYAQEANDETVGLANTAHQREVRDLIAAGLNPILSASGSGASTPSLRVPNLESIDGGIANNASGLARAVSTQQQLENDSLSIDNALRDIDLRRENLLFDDSVFSARKQLERDRDLSVYESELAESRLHALWDYMYGKGNWYIGEDGHHYHVPKVKRGFKKDVADSVRAEVKEAGTRYLQGWINTGLSAVNSGVGISNSARGWKHGAATLRHADEKLLQDDFFRSREDVRRQERHERWKFGGRKK